MSFALRVLWPERVALVAAAVVAGGSVFFWLVLAMSVGTLGDIKLDRAALGWFLDAEAGLVLPLWLLLRAMHAGIDFICRRRSPRSGQAIPVNPPGDPKTGA